MRKSKFKSRKVCHFAIFEIAQQPPKIHILSIVVFLYSPPAAKYALATLLPELEQVMVALAYPRMARPGEVIPERDLNAEEISTNEPHEQTSVLFIGTCFSCRARGSNPGPMEIVILQ